MGIGVGVAAGAVATVGWAGATGEGPGVDPPPMTGRSVPAATTRPRARTGMAATRALFRERGRRRNIAEA